MLQRFAFDELTVCNKAARSRTKPSLARLRPPEHGIIPPAEFITLAEETGLIVPIGQWVLQEAFKQLSAWPGLDYLAVNISPRQFRDPAFERNILEIIARDPNVCHRLMLEITESCLIEEFEDSLQKMLTLKRLGIGISIDDFGTGYSSLSYLKNLPVDQLKIDQKFIHDISTNTNDAVIVDTIIAMAQHLGLGIVAEGVETREQVKFLNERDCFHLQGYYLGKPMPAEAFSALLDASKSPLDADKAFYG